MKSGVVRGVNVHPKGLKLGSLDVERQRFALRGRKKRWLQKWEVVAAP